ncbi:MAG TPA: VOC family protein [Mycobacteriales bacterium]|nr:VOC family protein [Mycobacteriales bacterium]
MSHYPPITPHLAIADVAAAIDFYAKAFDAQERLRLTLPDGSIAHAELEVNGALVTLGAAIEAYGLVAPDPDGPVQVAVTLSVPDVDAAYERAVRAGATGQNEPADQFHGDRTASIRCPYGHKWIFQTHLRDVPQEEQQRLLTEMMSGS